MPVLFFIRSFHLFRTNTSFATATLLLAALIFTGAGGQSRRTTMTINSSAFKDGGTIPAKYCYHDVVGGKNISLPFSWTGVPGNTRSLALSIVDPHPVAKNWVHWFVINIPIDAAGLSEGASERSMPKGTKELFNTYGTVGYGGPEPPPGSGSHPYVVTLYALNVDSLGLTDKTRLSMFEKALEGKVIGTAKMTGYFER